MKKKYHILVFIVFISVLIFYHIFGYIGHYGYDDLHYAKLANDFNNGIINYNDHFSFRTPVILLTSLSYSLFGISDFTSALPAIIIATLILFIVFSILKNKSLKTLIIGLTLTTFSNWFIFYSDKLMPDIYVAFSVMTTLFIIHRYKYSDTKKNPLFHSILLNLSLLFGFMAKGTIVLIIPLMVYLISVDLILRRDLKLWIYTLVTGCIILLIYFTGIWLLTGDFLKRFDAISGNSYLSKCSYDKQSVIILLRRISYEFFKLIIYQGMATGYIFIIAYTIGKKSFKYLKFNDSFSYWITSSLILLFSSNFMSVSLSSYSPMCLDPRHYLFLIPIVSIPASTIITEFIENKNLKIQILSVVLLTAVISIFLQGGTFWTIYMPLTILFLVYSFIRLKQLYQTIFTLLFIIIMFIDPWHMVKYAQNVKYRKQKEIFSNYILKSKKNSIIITNDVQKRLAEYYNKFNNTNENEFFNYKEFKYDSTDNRKKLLFLNWYTRYLSNMDYQDLPEYAKYISQNNTLIYNNKELNISIYEMKDFTRAEHISRTLLDSKNDFEKKEDNWTWDKSSLSNEIKYEGKRSNEVKEYSSTFEYSLDALETGTVNQIVISCNLYCYFTDKANSKLVISVEDKNGAYIWKALEVSKYIKAYSNWWPVKYEVAIEKKELKANSNIKIYLWNINKKTAYVDNFEIKVTGMN